MEFTIYSLGSATYLEEILNAIAMISGSGDIEALAKIGLIIGTLLLGFQAVFNNTSIEFHKVGLCVIIYMAMFGTTGRALIQDVYTSDVAVVDNVPIGPLMVGSTISTIGYGVTNIMEQAFSTPAMTEYGFADPLTTLMAVRQSTKNVMSLTNFGKSTGSAQLMQSWNNYMRECTMTMVNRDPESFQNVMTNAAPIQGLLFDSDIYFTLILDGTAGGRNMTCKDAHAWLTTQTAAKGDDLFTDIAHTAFTKPGVSPDGPEVETKLGNALVNVGLFATSARDFAISSAMLPLLQSAPSLRATEDLQGAAAVMMNQAIQQQNTQWAAEGSMFTRYIRPFMTFFEGFVYAITPLMAFALALGGSGIGLASKYMLLLLWMTLWTPVMSIVNLYTLSTTAAQIEGITNNILVTGTNQGISFESILQIEKALESSIGVAGLMASSVPALCMFLVYGTSVAASGIASKLGGSDTINEKIASPDVVSPGAGLSVSSMATADWDKGTRMTGSENQRGDVQIGKMLSDNVASSHAKSEQSAQNFTQQASSAYANAFNSSKTIGDQAKVGESVSSTFGLTNNSDYKQAVSNMKSMGASSDEINATVGKLTADASGSLSASSSGPAKMASASVKGGVSGSQSTSTNRSESDRSAQLMDMAKSSGLSQSVQSGLSKANGHEVAQNFLSSNGSSLSQTDTNTLSKSASQVKSDQESYQKTESLAKNYGYGENLKLDSFAGKLMNDGKSDKVISAAQDNYGDQLQENYKALHGSGGMLDSDRAMTAAAALTLAQNDRFDLLAGAAVDQDSNKGLTGAGDLSNLEHKTASAGHGEASANAHEFDSSYGAKQQSAVDTAKTKEQQSNQRHNDIVENDSNVYKDHALREAGEKAANNIRGTERELNDKGENSLTDWYAVAANAAGGLTGMRADREVYEKEGRDMGLNDAQSNVFAAARRGDMVSDTKDQWDQYAASQHMDHDLSEGMFKQLVQAGLHDEGAAGKLSDVLQYNEATSGKSFSISTNNYSKDQHSAPQHTDHDFSQGSFKQQLQAGQSAEGHGAPSSDVFSNSTNDNHAIPSHE